MEAALVLVRAAEAAAAAPTSPRSCSETRGPTISLVAAAAAASRCTQHDSTSAADPSSSFRTHDSIGVDGGGGGGVWGEGDHPPRFVWANGLARPAASAKQAGVLSRGITSSTAAAAAATATAAAVTAAAAKAPGRVSSAAARGTLSVRCVSPAELVALVPGLKLPAWVEAAAAVAPERQQQQPEGDAGRSSTAGSSSGQPPQQQQQEDLGVADAVGSSSGQQQQQQGASCAGMFIPCGVVLDVPRYLESVWRACQVRREAYIPNTFLPDFK